MLKRIIPLVFPLAFIHNTATADTVDDTVFRKCASCHAFAAGASHKMGPNLYPVYGSVAGTQAGFGYSKALRTAGIEWSDETLSAFLANPRKVIPGNRMPFLGISDPEERKRIVEYLRENGVNSTGNK